MRRSPLFGALAALALAAGPARGQPATGAGTASGQFLRIGADARAAAMGQAYGALADDAAAVYWNPAGLARLEDHHLTFTHAFHFQSMFHDFLAYAQPIELHEQVRGNRRTRTGEYGVVGFGLQYLNAGNLDEVDKTGTATGSSFSPADLALSVSWARPFGDWLDFGATGKYVQSKIRATARTVTGDVGVKLRLPGGLALAASGHNLFGGLEFATRKDPLPRYYRIGASARPTVAPMLAAASEVVIADDDDLRFGFGGELRFPAALFSPRDWGPTGDWGLVVRAGYNSTPSGNELGSPAGAALGGGYWQETFTLDYAWLPFGFLGTTHRVTLGYRF